MMKTLFKTGKDTLVCVVALCLICVSSWILSHLLTMETTVYLLMWGLYESLRPSVLHTITDLTT